LARGLYSIKQSLSDVRDRKLLKFNTLHQTGEVLRFGLKNKILISNFSNKLYKYPFGLLDVEKNKYMLLSKPRLKISLRMLGYGKSLNKIVSVGQNYEILSNFRKLLKNFNYTFHNFNKFRIYNLYFKYRKLETTYSQYYQKNINCSKYNLMGLEKNRKGVFKNYRLNEGILKTSAICLPYDIKYRNLRLNLNGVLSNLLLGWGDIKNSNTPISKSKFKNTLGRNLLFFILNNKTVLNFANFELNGNNNANDITPISTNMSIPKIGNIGFIKNQNEEHKNNGLEDQETIFELNVDVENYREAKMLWILNRYFRLEIKDKLRKAGSVNIFEEVPVQQREKATLTTDIVDMLDI
jgi:hypothetical protein